VALSTWLLFDPAGASAHRSRARELRDDVSARERSLVDALCPERLVDQQRAMREHLDRWPRDFLVVRSLFRAKFRTHTEKEEGFRVMADAADVLSDDWAFLAQYGMLLQDRLELEHARQVAERSLELRSDNGVGAHVLAHVFHETADLDAGARWIADWYAARQPDPIISRHVAWHLAVLHLNAGRVDEAFDVYEREIAVQEASSPMRCIDECSFLWRLGLYETDRPASWASAAGALSFMAANAVGPVFAWNAALGAAKLGDTDSLSVIRAFFDRFDAEETPIASVGPVVVDAFETFAAGEFDVAASALDGVLADVPLLGGSHAQREIIEETLIVALLRSGRVDRAQELLTERLSRRESAMDRRWLAEAHTLAS